MTRHDEYGKDPLQILLRREQSTCKGCRYEKKVEDRELEVFVMVCKIKHRKHGQRCKNYEEKE